jgi:hypothetical protein
MLTKLYFFEQVNKKGREKARAVGDRVYRLYKRDKEGAMNETETAEEDEPIERVRSDFFDCQPIDCNNFQALQILTMSMATLRQ